MSTQNSAEILEISKTCKVCGVTKNLCDFAKTYSKSGSSYRNICQLCKNDVGRKNRAKLASSIAYKEKIKAESDRISGGVRLCKRCNVEKPLDDFMPQAECQGGRRPKCRLCEKEIKQSNPEFLSNKKRYYNNSKSKEKVTPEKIVCTHCHVEKRYTEFHKLCTHSTGRMPNCKVCAQLYQTKNYYKNEEYRRKRIEYATGNNRKRKYGVTPEIFNALLMAQNNKCAICDVYLDGSRFSLKGQLDHCHKTKAIRGILCGQCNTSLGNFKDDVNILSRDIQYIEKFKEK